MVRVLDDSVDGTDQLWTFVIAQSAGCLAPDGGPVKKDRLFFLLAMVVAVAAFFGARHFIRTKSPETKAPESAIAQEALVRPDSPSFGPADAKVTIVEFLDPECEACRAMHPIVKQLLSEYEGKVRLVIRYMPFHTNSMYAASVLEETRETGHFEKALETLFEHQPVWGSHHEPRPDLIPGYLTKIGVSDKVADRSYVLSKHGDTIQRDYRDGMNLGVRATPTFFVNGKMLSSLGYDALKLEIERGLALN